MTSFYTYLCKTLLLGGYEVLCFGSRNLCLFLCFNTTLEYSKKTCNWLSETRWESRIDALGPLRYQLGDVHNALMDIYEDRSLNGPTGNNSRVQALGLAKNIGKYNFVVSIVLWHSILFEINITSKQLQSKQFDLAATKDKLSKTKSYLQKLRCDEGF